jgi:hypothetical protein
MVPPETMSSLRLSFTAATSIAITGVIQSLESARLGI